ncbi:inaD-like protein [Heptranchias perlo]|uniref:inaD-like protein n=1 Tax=Heptranchias perlo TaxID=212740 RepID=UPI00355A035B
MVLEVNGISLQNVTHHEAVSALRNSGTVIKILILRGRTVTDSIRPHQNERSSFITHSAASNEEPESECVFLEEKMTTTCNGNRVGPVTSGNHTVNSASEMSQKSTSFLIVNHTMTRVQSQCWQM